MKLLLSVGEWATAMLVIGLLIFICWMLDGLMS